MDVDDLRDHLFSNDPFLDFPDEMSSILGESPESVFGIPQDLGEMKMNEEQFHLDAYLNEPESPLGSGDGSPASEGVYDSSPPQQIMEDGKSELLKRIEWSPEDFSERSIKRRRENRSREAQQEKHKSQEKKRRSDINRIIDRMRSTVPLPDSKLTKITVLHVVEEYLNRLETLCIQLLRQEANQPALPAKRKRNIIIPHPRVIRTLMVIFLLAVVVLDRSGFDLFRQHTIDHTPSRTLQEQDVVETSSLMWGWIIFKWSLLTALCLLVMAQPPPPLPPDSPGFAAARQQALQGEYKAFDGKFRNDIEPHLWRALHHMGVGIPAEPMPAALYLFRQLTRHVAQRLGIWLWLERQAQSDNDRQCAALLCKTSYLLLRGYSGPLDWRWCALTLQAINWAYAYGLNSMLRIIIVAAHHRMHSHLYLGVRLFDLYLNRWFAAPADSLLDTQVEFRANQLLGDSQETALAGDLVKARILCQRSLRMALSCSARTLAYGCCRAVVQWGVIAYLMGDFRQSLDMFRRLLDRPSDYSPQHCWGLLGAARSLLSLGETEKARPLLDRYLAIFGDLNQPLEDRLFWNTRALYWWMRGDVALSYHTLLKCGRECSEMSLGGVLGQQLTTQQWLMLWEDSLLLTSSLHDLRHDLHTLASESCHFLRTVSKLFPLARPKALLFSGQFSMISGDFTKAKRCWSSALQAAVDLGLNNDQALINQKLLQYSEQLSQASET
eukprot:TRINITY_DN1354_c0_g1_i2.p1 TRINITY_DN1354_c0_g1~~TRINITY_DN1354_c0_g1_i2.p1  ORF type:complete len:724 (-),score=123.95 TRINITY_DN1354_c0_g1_i2:31-2202(-)